MRAIAYQTPLPIDASASLVDIELPDPQPSGHDLLVAVEAISVNPADVKVRASSAPPAGEWKVLGWDAAGVVRAVGPEATRFHPGDRVFYAGDITRPGSYSALHCVDERIVGHMPASLDFAEAAALPLTAITAWEALFDRLDVRRPVPGAATALLIIGGAGGVGSIATQLARHLTGLTVIATASRPETRDWVERMGAHHIVDHSQPLAPQVQALGLGAPAFVFGTTQTQQHLADIAELIAPQGRFALIDDHPTLDIMAFKRKSVSIHWEFMFTRSMFATADLAAQGELLDEVARRVDAGQLQTTLHTRLGPIDAATLKRAHALVETGSSIGKVVVEGWK
ncbi:MAG: zinc-binding alcohol dehydrogenase family protein [Thiomonas sp.]|uniref:zinc-binding alcohol dehydrogenase family protein n=1 Tax=Thiomonas sp. TaxID=2047785 RepID=UPI002A36C611|nr:zinc-binding alcohol dehydrogenase family protein [Thiomonas sp.]MDY0329207.1 zinc-binding alcohol dehydrogenase family protein [Thiomonas sp.]